MLVKENLYLREEKKVVQPLTSTKPELESSGGGGGGARAMSGAGYGGG
jgi:hypothetical protein